MGGRGKGNELGEEKRKNRGRKREMRVEFEDIEISENGKKCM